MMLKVETPYSIQNLTVKNRILRSATMENMANDQGFVTDALVNLYHDLALGGTGLIITGASAVEQRGRVWGHQTALWDDKYINGLAKIAEVIHLHGSKCKCAVQLHHGGMTGFGYSYGAKDSGYSLNDASETEIRKTIDAFAKAAIRVKKAGFDAISVHAAHGYLISQFLSPLTNNRSDNWGGNLEKRMRFALEVCRSIRNRVGQNFPLLWKMNCADYCNGGSDFAEYAQIAKKLVEAGVDLIEVSGGVKEQIKLRNKLKREAGEKEAYFRNAIKPFRNAIGKKALAITGGIRSLNIMQGLIDEGVDLLGICRPLISEPDFPKKIFDSQETKTARCISCNKCLLRIATQPLKCVEFDKTDAD
ncbi:MAG: NADH:flavin oxidoreductase [Deltaproteobacteria bacterium]|jgi:2,4-dienoyl-CoA reductase-like NADH-dependent reductase (Old Yellow Enzyme family)|nr:NADH:flavin oxidoreductase [Deltaproteobacteria bacterium]